MKINQKMKNLLFIILFSILSATLSAQNEGQHRADSLKLLVVTGGPTLRYQIDLVPTSFYSLFTGYKNLFWDHATHDEAAFQTDRLSDFDVVLLYNRSDSISTTSKQNLMKYLESGKGLIVLHHALGSYNNWEWWWKEVVGGKYQMQENPPFPKSDFKQGEKINMIAQKDHPISTKVGKFSFIDETYKNLWISPEAEILYKTDNSNSDGPTVWIGPYKKSKVIIIQPGHAGSAHSDSNYRNLIYHSILWVNGD